MATAKAESWSLRPNRAEIGGKSSEEAKKALAELVRTSAEVVKEMENSGLPSPIRKHSRPDPKIDDPPAIQLQACDLLAWELRRGKLDGLKAKKTEALAPGTYSVS